MRGSLFAVAAVVVSTAASATALPNGWEVHEADQFCYVWQSIPDVSGTEFGLALDANERATVILSNKAWQLKPRRDYHVTVGIPGSLKSMKAQSLDIGGGRLALAAAVNDAGFVRRFESSPLLQFELRKVAAGPSAGSFKLDGAGDAVSSLRSCQEKLRAKVRALAKYKADRDASFRTDPHGDDWIPPTGSNPNN